MTKKTTLSVVALLLLLTGCGIKSPEQPIEQFSLKILDISPHESPLSDSVLKIYTPDSSKIYKGDEILYDDQHLGLSHYLYSKWSDTPAIMLENLIVISLSDSGLFKATVHANSRVRSQLLLESYLTHFLHDFKSEQTSYGELKIRFNLLDARNRELIATQKFDYQIPAKTPDAKGAVSALNEASGKLTVDMIKWLKTVITES